VVVAATAAAVVVAATAAAAVVVAATAAAVVVAATAAAVIAPLVPVVGKIAVMALAIVLPPKVAMPMTKGVFAAAAPLVAVVQVPVVQVPVVATISPATAVPRANRLSSSFT
jgi:hypothetical protein